METGGDKRGDEVVGIGAGAGIDNDIHVVTGPALAAEAGPDIVTDVFTCRRTSASVWSWGSS